MSVRLVATDLDGTALLPGGVDASDRVKAAVSAVRAAGIEVAVVTARNWRSATTLATMLGAEPYVVCANGAVVWDLRANGPVATALIPPEDALALVDAIRTSLPELLFHWEGVTDVGRQAEYHRWSPLPPWFQESDIVIGEPEDLIGYPLAKLLVRIAGPPTEAHAATEALWPLVQRAVGDRAVVTISGGTFVELSAPGVDKASGVADLCRLLGVDRAEVVAIGDQLNDLCLLQWAGRGVAMGDAHPEVLSAVADRTATNAEDGVALVLEGLLEDAGRLG